MSKYVAYSVLLLSILLVWVYIPYKVDAQNQPTYFGPSAGASSPFVTPADVSGDGNVHTFSTASGQTQARWIQVIAAAGNSNVVRIGDSTIACGAVGTGHGLPLYAGGGMMLPQKVGTTSPIFVLQNTYYCVSSGDYLTWAWGN